MNIVGSPAGYYNIVEFFNSSPVGISTYYSSLCAVQRAASTGGSLLTLRPNEGIPPFTQFASNSGYIVLAKESFNVPEDQTQPNILNHEYAGTPAGYFSIFRYPFAQGQGINTYYPSLCAIQRASSSGGSVLTLRPNQGIPPFTQFSPNSGYVILARRNFYISSLEPGTTWAFDDANQSAYDNGWQDEDNGGRGLDPWNLNLEGPSSGVFIGSANTAGFANIDTNGKSWGMFGNPQGQNNYSHAERGFVAPLLPGQTLSGTFAVVFRNGNKGFNLYNSSTSFLPENELLNFNVGSDQYTLNGGNLNWTYEPTLAFEFYATQTTTNLFNFTLVRGASSVTIENRPGQIRGLKFYCGDTESGTFNDLYFNSIATYVEPLYLFGVTTELPNANRLSYLQLNGWETPDINPPSDVPFAPILDISVYAPFGLTIAGSQVVPDYTYVNEENGYFAGYINRPDCVLSGWFVSQDSATPVLYNSGANVSPTFIPPNDWYTINPEVTVPASVSAFQISLVPNIFTGINTNAYNTLSSNDYIFNSSNLSYFRNLRAPDLDQITSAEIIGYDGGTTGVGKLPAAIDLTFFKNLSSFVIETIFSGGPLALRNLTLPINSKLERLALSLSSSITALNYKPGHIYPNFKFGILNVDDAAINNTQDENLIDDLIKSIYMSSSAAGLTAQLNSGRSLTYAAITGGRTSTSDEAFLKTVGYTIYNPLEIDPYFPIQTLPTGTYYPHTLGNTLVVQAPVSANGSTFVRFNALSGIYTKTGDIKDNRDVFRNPNDYFVLFDEPKQLWTVVGPLSTSTTVWLSAQETIGDYGNIPVVGWGGIAYRNGGAFDGNPWLGDTCVFSTQLYAYSALRTIGGRYGFDPFQGFDYSSYWKDLDFSGIGYLDVVDPEWNARCALISPVHFINTSHFPATLNPGTTFKFIHRDGTVSTRSVLSAVGMGLDVRVGILNEPVSAAQYPIGSAQTLLNSLTAKTDFKKFILGPTSSGEVSYALPTLASAALTYNAHPLAYGKYYSIPKSAWYSMNNLVVGESSTGMWIFDNNTLAIAGMVKYANFSSDTDYARVYSSIYNAATSLSNAYFGGPFVYALSAYNFNTPPTPTPTPTPTVTPTPTPTPTSTPTPTPTLTPTPTPTPAPTPNAFDVYAPNYVQAIADADNKFNKTILSGGLINNTLYYGNFDYKFPNFTDYLFLDIKNRGSQPNAICQQYNGNTIYILSATAPGAPVNWFALSSLPTDDNPNYKNTAFQWLTAPGYESLSGFRGFIAFPDYEAVDLWYGAGDNQVGNMGVGTEGVNFVDYIPVRFTKQPLKSEGHSIAYKVTNPATSLILDGTRRLTDLSPFHTPLSGSVDVSFSTAEKKYGIRSIFLNEGTIFFRKNNLEFRTKDFTVEFWVKKPTGNPSGTYRPGFIDSKLQAGYDWSIALGDNITNPTYGTNWVVNGSSVLAVTGIPLNEWVHIAFTRTDGTLRVFYDGILKGSATDRTDYFGISSSENASIGAEVFPFTGYVDGLRIIKGYSLYTEDFTPPVGEFAVVPLSTTDWFICGINTQGQLGLGDNSNRSVFTYLSGDWDDLYLTPNATFALSGGKWFAAGGNSGGTAGNLGLGDYVDRNIFTPLTGDWERIVNSGSSTFALSGGVWHATGRNFYDEMGIYDTGPRSSFIPLTGNWDDLVAGNQTVYTLSAGTGTKWFASGLNGNAQCGQPFTTYIGLTGRLPVAGDWDRVILNQRTAYALSANTGTKWFTCGLNAYGQGGIGNFIGSVVGLSAIPGDYTDIKTNPTALCVAGLSGGKWFICGFNDTGQLGLGDVDNRSSFTLLPKNNIKDIVMGFRNTFLAIPQVPQPWINYPLSGVDVPLGVQAIFVANSIPLKVTTDAGQFKFDQLQTGNPELTCYRDTNYDFIISTSNFALRNNLNDTSTNVLCAYNNDPLNGKASGNVIMFTPAAATPDTIYYLSTSTPSQSGKIVIKDY